MICPECRALTITAKSAAKHRQWHADLVSTLEGMNQAIWNADERLRDQPLPTKGEPYRRVT